MRNLLIALLPAVMLVFAVPAEAMDAKSAAKNIKRILDTIDALERIDKSMDETLDAINKFRKKGKKEELRGAIQTYQVLINRRDELMEKVKADFDRLEKCLAKMTPEEFKKLQQSQGDGK